MDEQDIPKKQCTACDQKYPATSEFFYRHKRGKYGLYSICKQCKDDGRRSIRSNRNPPTNGYKYCDRCEKEYPATPEFWTLHKQRRDGLQPWCKECMRSYHGSYHRLPEVQKRVKSWRIDHNKIPEVQAQTRNRYRAYYSRPDVQERCRAHAYRRIARKKSVSGTHTSDQIQDQLKRQKYKCYYCQKKLQNTKERYIYHIEHTFPLSRVAGTDIPANSMDYIVLACPACNLSKGNKFPWEWPEGGRLC